MRTKNRADLGHQQYELTGSIVAQLFGVMSCKPLLVIAALLSVLVASAANAQDEADKPAPAVRIPDDSREAIIREDHPRAVERSAPAPTPSGRARVVEPAAVQPAAAPPRAAAAPAADDQRRRDGGRDRGDNPPIGRAVPRDSGPPPSRAPAPAQRGGFDNRNRGVYVTPRVYNNYYYYPRRYYPYGYGAFGLGYFYYDPYTWYPPSYYPGYYGGYYGGYFDGYDVGELRLSVSPRFADVYVDGYFAGRVDDYDGIFQALKLEAGAHHIQIVAQGYAPLDFDVRIEAGRKITYRGALAPFRP
jgi:hypothetical protein